MKKERNLKKELAARKYKVPGKTTTFLYHFLFKNFVLRNYKPEIVIKDDINDCKGPCFLIWNHLSRIDHGYISAATYPRRISILAGYNEFFRSHLHEVFKLMNIIPKKMYAYDPVGIMAMNSVIKKGGCICFSPEGTSSIYGINQPVVVGTGHFIKHYRIPVYFLKMRGQYLTNTKICTNDRLGRTWCELSLLFTPEQLENMTDEEVEKKLDELFRSDDYEWGFENNISWKHNNDMAENLHYMCYKCPKCGCETKMTASGNTIKCENCGNGATIDDHYRFVPFDETCILPETPSKWITSERAETVRKIREDNKFSFSDKVSIGIIPDDHYLTKKKTSEKIGEGTLTFDHKGIHFKGTKNGEEFTLEADYKYIFTLTIVTDVTKFFLNINNEFYEFVPEHNSVGKMLLITEEMHRLHYNTWKNFPWFDWMYENLPEYVPAEEEEEL